MATKQVVPVTIDYGSKEAAQFAQAQIVSVYISALPPVNVSPPGYAIRVNWSPVYGAKRAEITSAVVQIGSAKVTQSLGDLIIRKVGTSYDVSVPDGKRIASLTLFGMKSAGMDINGQSSLPQVPEANRLVVATNEGGQISAPLYSVPPIPQRHLLPPSLTGASFNNRQLQLNDLKATKIRLSLVIKSFPEEFEQQDFTLERVSGFATILATDLELVDPAGTVIWSFPGEYPDQNPPATVDLRVNLEPALNKALNDKQPLDVTFHLRGKAPGQAGFRFAGAHGALVRDFPGVISTTLEGDPKPIALGDKLASEQPSSVVADLTVTYAGIRILEDLSDTLPASGPLSGFIVTDQQLARAFPPQAFAKQSVAKIGVIGRAPVACELSVQLVEMAGSAVGKSLGPPGVLKLEPSNTAETHWAELPPKIDLSQGNIGVAVRANKGRFFWVSDGDKPLVKVAIYDPNPAGRPLNLNHSPILTVDKADEIHKVAYALTANAFRIEAPIFESSLFLTVDVSDLTLRYGR